MQNIDYSSIPIISLSEVEKAWIGKLYELFKQGKQLRYRELRASLVEKLPYHFQRSDIDKRLVRYGLESISLLGIVAVEKNYETLVKADQIMVAIKDMLIKNPLKDEFKLEEIAKAIDLEEKETSRIFAVLSSYGTFYASAGGSGADSFGYYEFKIGYNDDVFLFYLNFKGVKKLLLADLEKEASQEQSMLFKDFDKPTVVVSDRGLSPVFSERPVGIDHTVGFVLMPFTEDWSDRVYKYIIRDHIESLGLQCLRADNKHGSVIMDDIWRSIHHAAFIVADMTGKNANVMYELGIAHSFGKPTILITQDTQTIPFDHKHLRHYQYHDHVDGADFFAKNFKSAIREIYHKYYPQIQLGNKSLE